MAAKKAVDYKAVSASALRAALVASEQGLENLPEEGGLEPDVVKGARGMLLGVTESLKTALAKVEEA
jgi:hypothetical protein